MAKTKPILIIDRQPLFNELCEELAGWNIDSVADTSGVCSSTIYYWLDGKTMLPRLDTITRVADAIGLKLVFVSKLQKQKPRHLASVK